MRLSHKLLKNSPPRRLELAKRIKSLTRHIPSRTLRLLSVIAVKKRLFETASSLSFKKTDP